MLPVEMKRQRVNMLSAVNSQGKVRFMIYQDTMNQQRLIRFMEHLIRVSKQKVFLILDNLTSITANLLRPGWKNTRIKLRCCSCRPMLRNIIRMNTCIMF